MGRKERGLEDIAEAPDEPSENTAQPEELSEPDLSAASVTEEIAEVLAEVPPDETTAPPFVETGEALPEESVSDAGIETGVVAEEASADPRFAVRSTKKARDEEEPLLEDDFGPLGYDLQYPADSKDKRRRGPINYKKEGCGRLILKTYDKATPFRVKINGRRFHYRKKNLPIGEIAVEVKTVFYVKQWTLFFMIFVDFFRFLFGCNRLGGWLRRQGVMEYGINFTMQRRGGSKDVEIIFDKEPLINSRDLKEVTHYHYKSRKDVQKRYDKYPKYAIPVLFFPPVAAVVIALLYFFLVLGG